VRIVGAKKVLELRSLQNDSGGKQMSVETQESLFEHLRVLIDYGVVVGKRDTEKFIARIKSKEESK